MSAATAYHWVYRDRVKPWLIADLLILKPAMPRSLISCYESIDRALDSLAREDGRSGAAQRQARAMLAALERASMSEIFQNGLHEFITDVHRGQRAARHDDFRAVSLRLTAPLRPTRTESDAACESGSLTKRPTPTRRRPARSSRTSADAAQLRVRNTCCAGASSVDVDGSLRQSEDSLGNVVHAFSYQGAIERFTVSAVGEVETTDAVGVVRGAVEPLPTQMFLRASPLAQVNGSLREFAARRDRRRRPIRSSGCIV